MVAHAKRGHSQWSASATARNWNCSGALALTDGLGDETNEAADWGTVCHEISELCLRDDKDADAFIGEERKGKKFTFEVDDEMAETAQEYVDYVRNRRAAYKQETGKNATLFLEENMTLGKLNPPFEAGGTGDAVLIFPEWELLEVVDLKTGRGVVVEAENNPQARTYALGALLKHPGHDITEVKSTIVQTRAAHKDGRIRSETYHVTELMEWTYDLLAKMQQSREAFDAFKGIAAGKASLAEWSAKWLSAGDHCDKTFCLARATCPALEKKAMDAVGLWFDEVETPHISNNPGIEDPDKMAQYLDAIDMIESWCKAVREHAHRMADSGVKIPNYVLVPKQGREKWSEGVEEKVLAAVREAGIAEDKYRIPGKLRTPKQVRKALGAKADTVEGLSVTPDVGTNLVRADKTTRQAVLPAVHKHFSAIE